jgi:hypothetical protein
MFDRAPTFHVGAHIYVYGAVANTNFVLKSANHISAKSSPHSAIANPQLFYVCYQSSLARCLTYSIEDNADSPVFGIDKTDLRMVLMLCILP